MFGGIHGCVVLAVCVMSKVAMCTNKLPFWPERSGLMNKDFQSSAGTAALE